MNELERISTEKKKLSQFILGNARSLIITFILFTVVVVMTTDIQQITISDISDIGLEFFLILFSSYAMYIFCADGGTVAGLATDAYKNAVARFECLKKRLLENARYSKLNDFCTFYIEDDLKKTRMHYLVVASISYDEYLEKYSKMSRAELKNMPGLTKLQKKAIHKANSVRMLKFTPNMITTMQGKHSVTRFALTLTPKMQKSFAFGTKFVKMSALSMGMSLIALQVIIEPSWAVFAEVCLKLSTVIINGFDGRVVGYNNITEDTVTYINAQCDLLEQAIQYADTPR